MHNFNHEQIDWCIRCPDDIDCINNNLDQLVSQGWIQLRVEACSSDTDQKWLINFRFDLELFQEFKALLLGQFIAFSDDSWVDLLH